VKTPTTAVVELETPTRAKNPSVAPDGWGSAPGQSLSAPSHSSKFVDEAAVKKAINYNKPGMASFTPPATGSTYIFEVPGDGVYVFGYGVPNGGGASVPMTKVFVMYKKDGAIWKIHTTYPKL
jgi:hypothetical protein